MADMPDFEHILNFRDVGATVNAFLGKKLIREGLLYRSARPDDASFRDRQRLVGEYGIKTMMDLRTKTEHAQQAKKRQADLQVPVLLQSNAALAEPVQIPGMRYLEINITGRRFNLHLVRQLSWSCFIKCIFLMLFGFRMRAIRILAANVMIPRGLIGLGRDTLDQSGPEIRTALLAIVQPPPPPPPSSSSNLPMVIHCTQGKDRTGLVVMLALMVLRVPAEAIAHDYRLTDAALVTEKEERLGEIRDLGLPDEFGDTAPAMIEETERYLDTKYGGIDGYLDAIQFGPEERQKMRDILLY